LHLSSYYHWSVLSIYAKGLLLLPTNMFFQGFFRLDNTTGKRVIILLSEPSLFNSLRANHFIASFVISANKLRWLYAGIIYSLKSVYGVIHYPYCHFASNEHSTVERVNTGPKESMLPDWSALFYQYSVFLLYKVNPFSGYIPFSAFSRSS
ncbi:MAG: hypothetical protein JWR76_846, partial [Mucilaginibacter sp.]|nr:hypothetical protein [Mucilaginibacter sp.]